MDTCDWEQSLQALKILENTLRCSYCECLLQEPCTLGNCDHLFCRVCIKEFVEKEHCPTCQAPAWARDLQVNRELSSVVQLFRKLRKIINSKPQLPVSGFYVSEDLEEEDALIPVIDDSDEEGKDHDEQDGEEEGFVPQRKEKGKSSNARTSRTRALKDKNNTVDGYNKNTEMVSLSKRSKRKKCSGVPNRPELIVDDENDPYALYENVTSPRREKKIRCVKQKGNQKKTGNTSQRKTARGQRTKKAMQKKLEKANDAWKQMNKEPNEDLSATGKKRVLFSDCGSDDDSTMASDGDRMLTSKSGKAVRSQRGTSKCPPEKTMAGKRVGVVSEDSGCLTGSSEPCNEGVVEVIKPALLRSIMKRNIRGETPLHVASIKGNLAQVQELLLKGSDTNVKDHAGWTPLHEACNLGHVDIVAALLDHGAMINMPGFDNDSPLHDAVANNRPEVVQLLIERGASLDVRNIHGRTPKDLPASPEVMEALKTKPGVTADLNTSFNSSISSSPSCPKKIVLLGTGLNDKQKSKLQSCARLLRGKVTSDFTQNITHLVTNAVMDNRCSRTMKFLQAVLLGKWVVNFTWVEECLKVKGLVPEVNHEICGTTIDSDSEGARKSREMANSQFPALFDGCHFYLHGNFVPPTPGKDELALLLKLGGGVILTRYPKPDDDVIQASTIVPYHAKQDSELASCSYFIVYDTRTKRKPPPRVRTAKLCTVPVSWVMDCISRYELTELPSS